MSGLLNHSPADVLGQALVQLGLGTDPAASPQGSWPVHVDDPPDTPDEIIVVSDSSGLIEGVTQFDGEAQEDHGFQVLVRGRNHQTGYPKASAVAIALDQQIRLLEVTLGGRSYLLWSVSRTSDVVRVGKESPSSKRRIFTINGTLSVRMR